VTDGGRRIVTDYKTGNKDKFAKVAEDHFLTNRSVQLAVYGLAVRDGKHPVTVEYWFVTERGEFKRLGYDFTLATPRHCKRLCIPTPKPSGEVTSRPTQAQIVNVTTVRICSCVRPTGTSCGTESSMPDIGSLCGLGGAVSESSPPDQAARTSAMEDLGSTLFVEAGAGTGKTTMLVNRVVNLVTIKGAHMDQIAAITFTEAAAAELRDRLAKEFEKMALEEQNERAEAARLALDAAAVTTLHGFARKILADHPFSVGLPPLFDVADESSDRVAFDERWGEFVHSLLEDPHTSKW